MQWNRYTRSRVVRQAILSGNQSERSKIFFNQSESSIEHTWPKWRHNAHIWASKFTWPHRKKNTTHSSHSFNDRVEPGDKRDACAVQPQTFTLRSHVNRIVSTCADRPSTPQVPRVHVSLCPPRPTAHAQTLKRSPRPFASPSVNKKHTVWRSTSFNTKTKIASALSYKRDVGEVWVTTRPWWF